MEILPIIIKAANQYFVNNNVSNDSICVNRRHS